MRNMMTMVWLLVVLICLTMALTIAYSQTTANASSASSSEESKKTIVSEEKTLFSWGVVAALLAAAGAAATAMAQTNAHIKNTDIHHSGEKMSDKFVQKTTCQHEHDEIKKDFEKVHSRLDEQLAVLSRIDGKINSFGGK